MASLLPDDAVSTIDFSLNRTAVLWSGVLALGTGLVFGMFPAFHSTRPDLVSTLKDQAGQKGASKAAARFRSTLATVQIALSMTLLVAAGLFTRSLLNVSRVDLGIRTDNVITFAISLQLIGYTTERTAAFFERLENELAAAPGVSSVTASTVGIIAGSNCENNVSVQGFAAGPDTDTNANFTLVGTGYFRTLGVPLQAGREFTRADARGAPKVVIVNEAFAKKFNLGRDAVGKRMTNGSGASTGLDIEIIGLVQNAKYSEVKQRFRRSSFSLYRQDERLGFMNFYVRTTGDPNLLLPSILAGVGLYGVLAYTVAQRTREIGLRMALGADGARVRGMVLRQVGWMTVIGGVVGLGAAVGLGRLAQSLLFELQGHDPIVLAGSAVLLVLVALGAGLIPALRASRIDSMLALRYE